MSRKLPRLLFVASMAAGASLAPMLGAAAEPRKSSVDAYNPEKGGFVVPAAKDPRRLDINVGDTVTWNIMEGDHTVTPRNEDWWGQPGSGTLTPGPERYTATNFDKPGKYVYYCTIHGSIGPGANDDPQGMWGFINVIDPTPPPPPPPPPPASSSSTTTTTPPTTAATTRPTVPATAPPASSAGTKTPTTAAPPPTTSTAKDKDKGNNKDKKPKEEETTTTTAPPPPPAPIDLPDSAIVPPLPGFDSPGTTVQGGVEAPGDTPAGDAVALLTSGKGGGGTAKKLLIVSGLGLGVLGLGTAGYKFANRSSKYFPA